MNLLENIIISTVDIPSLPRVAQKILQLVNKDTTSIAELETLISRDQSFSTRVLRIANSSFYGRRRAIDTVSEAIMLIGFNTMKSLVVGASLKDLHRKHGPIEQRLWEHSLGVSIGASLLAQETKIVSSDEALVGGLVHDVGKTVINNSVPDSYALIDKKINESGIPSIEIESKTLGFNHCEIGGFIARKWQFPKDLEAAIEYHHNGSFPSFEEVSYEGLCQVINVADAMCLKLGIGLEKPNESLSVGFDHLGIGQNKFDSLMNSLKQIYSEQKP